MSRKLLSKLSALALSVLFLSGCRQDAVPDSADGAVSSPLYELTYNIVFSPGQTKSILSESSLEIIRNLTVIGIDETGFTQAVFIRVSDPGNLPDTHCVMKFLSGRSVEFYAVANMGDISDDIPMLGGVPDMESFRYRIESFEGLNTSGVPMAGRSRIDAVAVSPTPDGHFPVEGVTPVHIQMERLLAKVNIHIDKKAVVGTNVSVMPTGSVYVRQVNRTLTPFSPSGSRAASSEDVFSGNTDYYTFSASDGQLLEHDVTVYVPENLQGRLLPDSATQEDKSLEGAVSAIPQKGLLTYIEYTADRNGVFDGLHGSVTYRLYLGSNATNDFSVERSGVYNATLMLSWDGMVWNADGWRIDDESLTDERLLTLSAVPGSLSVSTYDIGTIQQGAEATVYVNFSRDNGMTWSPASKDLNVWPYGWQLFIDGTLQESGEGTAEGDIVWTYGTDAMHRDYIIIRPGHSSVKGTGHVLQVKTSDGKHMSNAATFAVSNTVYGVFIEPATNTTLAQGASVTYRAYLVTDGVKSSEPISTGVSWISSDPSIASISANGTATGIAVGSVTVTAQFTAPSGETITGSSVLTIVAAGGGGVNTGTEDGGEEILG